MAITAQTAQLVPSGGSHGFIKPYLDKDGNKIEAPTPFMIPAFVGIDDISDTQEIKTAHGNSGYAIMARGGKKSLKLSFTVDAFTGAMLNALYYGAEAQNKQQSALVDGTGYTIPSQTLLNVKIRETIAFNLGRWDSTTSVKIGGTSATLETQATIRDQHYKVSNGKHSFSKGDKGKALEITLVSNGTTVVMTTTVPDKLTFNTTLFSASTAVKKNAGNVALTRDTYSLTSAAPADEHYMASGSGVHILSPTQTVTYLTVVHKTDGMAGVSSKIATLPAAGYYLYIDPPSAATYAAMNSVVLTENSGTAMTGVAVDGELTLDASPTSGKYNVDAKGYMTFAAADVGDSVQVSYLQDYYPVSIRLPDGATYLEDLGVRTQGGMPFTRVAYSSPLSIVRDQYYVNEDNGDYYFDFTNSGDTVFIDCMIEEDGGNFIDIENDLMGKSPTFILVLHNSQDGEKTTITYLRCKSMGVGIPLKQDPSQMKFDIQMFADRVTGKVGTISTTA